MDCTSTRLPYRQTAAFSRIAMDYLNQAPALQPFSAHHFDIKGLEAAIRERQQFPTDRLTLVNQLKQQYSGIRTSAATEKNIESLAAGVTFTITTAHQPNLFTGPLYFLYKIMHAIRLAENCKTLFPQYDFVPVYYMGSEDADLDELGHFNFGKEKYTWETKQTGAVGRMKVDKALLKLIDRVEGRLAVEPKGDELVKMIRQFFKEGTTLQDATFALVNALFSSYGLVVLIPDSAALKSKMQPVFADDLLNQSASGIVEETAKRLDAAGYKVQAYPREINLFYLDDGIRNRIEKKGSKYIINDTDIVLEEKEILDQLKSNPERFSPNVILRGLYQSTILPDIIFIGGGGETAYWLQLKDLFNHYRAPFPVLILRNSFLFIDKKQQEKIAKLGFSLEEIFLGEEELVNRLVQRETDKKVQLNGTLTQTEKLYDAIREQAGAIDVTLERHVEALKERTLHSLRELEKKMLRAEKRKFSDQRRQVQAMKEKLFPGNGLQERVENFMPFYAKWGTDFLKELYRHSLGLEQEFVVLKEG